MDKQVKVVGVAFSPRHGNTEIQVREALRAAEEIPGVKTEYYSIVGKILNPCDSCYRCFQNPDPSRPCPAYDDPEDCFNEIANLILGADGIIFGSPVYYMSVTAQMKAFIDRTMGIEAFGWPLRNKVAGFLTVAFDRNGGQENCIQDMVKWAMMQDMLCVSVGPERPAGASIGGYLGAMAMQGFPMPLSSSKPEGSQGIRQDEQGMQATRQVGWRVAEMAKVIKAGFQGLEKEDTRWPRGAVTVDMLEAFKNS